MRKHFFFSLVLCLLLVPSAMAQKVGFIDSQSIMDALPETKDAKRRLEVQTTEWQNEIKRKRENLDRLVREYRAKEVLYTPELKQQKQNDIIAAEKDIADYQNKKLGVNGEYFTLQSSLMKPIQDRLLTAAKKVATDNGYDYIFDRSSETLLLYANETHNLTQKVLERLSSLLPTRENQPAGTTGAPPAGSPPPGGGVPPSGR
jgi:outer membrane protein